MKTRQTNSAAGMNRKERDTRVELSRRFITRRSTRALFSVWMVFSAFSWAVTSAAADESGGLFPGNGSGYSVLVEIETSALHQDSMRPEVIYEIGGYRPRCASNSLAARLDFAFSEGLVPGWRVTDGLEYILDKEEILVDGRDLTKQDIEEMGPENGYLGLSLFVHRPVGSFTPYVWVRGGVQPIPVDEGLEASAKYAVNARCGIPFKVTPNCSLSVDAGYVLGFVQGLSGTYHAPSLTASLQLTF